MTTVDANSLLCRREALSVYDFSHKKSLIASQNKAQDHPQLKAMWDNSLSTDNTR